MKIQTDKVLSPIKYHYLMIACKLLFSCWICQILRWWSYCWLHLLEWGIKVLLLWMKGRIYGLILNIRIVYLPKRKFMSIFVLHFKEFSCNKWGRSFYPQRFHFLYKNFLPNETIILFSNDLFMSYCQIPLDL